MSPSIKMYSFEVAQAKVLVGVDRERKAPSLVLLTAEDIEMSNGDVGNMWPADYEAWCALENVRKGRLTA